MYIHRYNCTIKNINIKLCYNDIFEISCILNFSLNLHFFYIHFFFPSLILANFFLLLFHNPFIYLSETFQLFFLIAHLFIKTLQQLVKDFFALETLRVTVPQVMLESNDAKSVLESNEAKYVLESTTTANIYEYKLL